MQFGYFDTLMRPDRSHEYGSMLDDLREVAKICDQAGFHTLWLAEHHMGPEGMDQLPNPILLGADLASRTSQLRLGQACNCLPYWHPIRLAEDIAMLDQMTDGRVEVAFGKGTKPRDATAWHPNSDPRDGARTHELYAESLEVIRKAWTQEFFAHDGPNYTFPRPGTPWFPHALAPADPAWSEDGIVTQHYLAPKPLQQPHPPLWMVSDSDLSIQFAAEHGMKVILWQPPVEKLKERFEHYRKFRTGTEGKEFSLGEGVGLMRSVYVAPTMEEARRDAERGIMHIYNWIHPPRRGLGMFMRPGEEPTADMHLDFDFLMERCLIVGSPEHVREKIAELRDTLGLEHLLAWTNVPWLSQSKILRSIELLATEVMPAFRDGV